MRIQILTCVLPLAAAGVVQRKSDDVVDYIVVGGGTSGLVVAKRLSEDPTVSVLVIEAGDSVYDNENVTDVNGYGLAFGTDIDYAFESVNQTYADGKAQTLRAGKALGGTSTINGMAYTRTESAQVDAWELVGNKGWNWNNLFPYYLKSEHFQTPSQAREAAGHLSYEAQDHGYDGPLLTGWPYSVTNTSLVNDVASTYDAMGLSLNSDLNGGSMVGFSVFPYHIDQELNVREDAARAYYYPYQNATNLKVLLNTRANKLVWASNSSNGATAEGVSIASSNGETKTIKATKEVIISAGALSSPRLLELSGIGNPAILSQYGIDVVVDLPTVGENLQDQSNNGIDFGLANNYTLADKTALVAYPSVSHLFGNQTASFAQQVKANLSSYAARVASANGNVTRPTDLLEFYELQYDLIFKSQVPFAEVLINFASTEWASEFWSLLPFSRGSVHIRSSDPGVAAAIDPKYFMLEFDGRAQAEVARYVRKLYSTEPFASYNSGEVSPGIETVSASADDEAWVSWIKETYRSNFHSVGTAAMMPREKGGVVDTELRVYGTSNVRVVDASVVPFQVCGHSVSTLYAVAERASDFIRGKQ
ncbi:hypothetical protein PFICI_06523 [Pestalotiopsis fici W106-1]|uniref:Glucose-methanol-choline oxidoreductase N-terminal domain-containing protein n=1 Tax=Pestalotiopsis fici (strain W106-1 / CGMCC3.15140) TaxID=1229662 RepID=W3X8K5_PESFW|nr:uncharacterized protein PFICI_06523 [Pestalotiopsis fici W106-1]ETS81521.1 hypothetical protein PFICI_06523 [Pestalotiopsis fici W106-1]